MFQQLTKTLAVASLILISSNSLAFSNDPVSSYIHNGQPVGAWKLSIGNAMNYYIPMKEMEAKTERGNLEITPTKKQSDNDAINIKWRGKKVKNEWGGNTLGDSFVAIGKNKIDLEPVKDLAALVLDLRVLRSPNENVTLTMQCKYSNKCKGTYHLKSILKKLPKKEWTYLPIPLNCIGQGDFDFSAITNFSIATQGKLEIEVANIGLTGLQEGDKGCAK
ncbi:hypothetical protein C2869_16045 [Saccharobesus litoralis]|uniref:ExoP galactose-binding-like domain-containing protein n=1 Tax=Saccharobesus litoralis TaxID=2172099 RepID=A0A2S0VUI1_9ALTE|nr:putative glycoside hydrolase [Saccharobesus litoralis]AWB67843.1 hypothetical protein C2869_16045 [Saccharobesus litoralis]